VLAEYVVREAVAGMCPRITGRDCHAQPGILSQQVDSQSMQDYRKDIYDRGSAIRPRQARHL
jgi:hypothetical protein